MAGTNDAGHGRAEIQSGQWESAHDHHPGDSLPANKASLSRPRRRELVNRKEDQKVISDVRDESDRIGMRIVIEIKA